jgi:hypothetical protein
MIKKTSKPKLRLNKEIVKQIADSRLEAVVGGGHGEPPPTKFCG